MLVPSFLCFYVSFGNLCLSVRLLFHFIVDFVGADLFVVFPDISLVCAEPVRTVSLLSSVGLAGDLLILQIFSKSQLLVSLTFLSFLGFYSH